LNTSSKRERARVLVADDSPPFLERIVDILCRHFCVVGAVTTGAELVDAAGSLQPDVVVADIYMPVMNGLEAAVLIHRRGSQVPIVLMTAHHEHELIEAVRVAGALGYVTKLHLAHDLVPAIQAALEGRRYLSASASTS
jgi:DNA-binding NarL/FixJ family response regulator